jgi:F-box interacting protein
MPLFWEACYGLGYCSVTKNHKVVRLFSRRPANSCCEVLVLGTPAYWRPTAQQPPSYYVDENNPAVYLNGHLHFFAHEAGIVTFDTSSETFDLLPLPLPWPGLHNSSLTELDGCLCFCNEELGGSDAPFHVFLLRDYYMEAPRWEKLCCIDRRGWPESDRVLLQSLCIAPLCVYHSDDGRRKIMFGTGTLKVFAVDPDREDAPEILFTPDGTIIGSCDDDFYLTLGLFEEHLGPVGRTIEEMVFSAPMTKAWSDVLKWMSARSVSELSLVCRDWRAMIMTDRFIQSHVFHANLSKSPRVMIILDATYGLYVDLKDFPGSYALAEAQDLVCSQPCHGLNVGSCNSLDFVCNPAMGYYQRVESANHDVTFFAGRIGLGYDSKISRHVLVHISYKKKDLVTREYKLECKLRYVKDRLWHMVDPPSRPVADMPPAYVNGKICWMAEPNLGPVYLSCEIVAFNVGAGKFEIMEGPPCSPNNGRMSMLQLRGALCVACSDKSTNVIDIWMMHDTGTWSMEYHIQLSEFSPDYSSENTTPLAVDPNDERILLKTGRSLGYYNPKMAALEIIFSVSMPGYCHKFCPIICEESLVCPLGPC